MNFITKLTNTRLKNDAIMVVVDKLTKEERFIPVKKTHKIDNIAYIYMKEVARFHGIMKSIVSYRDSMKKSSLNLGNFSNIAARYYGPF